jgi:hypothetical protein
MKFNGPNYLLLLRPLEYSFVHTLLLLSKHSSVP